MIRVLVILLLISVISGCTLPDWKVDNKDKRYSGKWYFYKQRIVQDFQKSISRCVYAEFTQEKGNPLKWIANIGFTNKTTGKDVGLILHGSSEKENSGLYSYQPPLDIVENIVCGDVDGVRVIGIEGYLTPSCPDKEFPFWVALENRRNSTHPPTAKEQKKIDKCLKRNKIDPESLSLIDNENCTN